MARVLITNAYSARNRGDAAIILGMIESLRRTAVFQGAEIRISTADFPADSGRYPERTVPSFQSLKNSFSGRPSANQLYFLAVLLPLSLLWALGRRAAGLDLPVPSSLRDLLREYADADVVVAAGGGYLYTRTAVQGNVVLLTNVFSFFFGVVLGKPVVLFAQSIGPFAGRCQSLFVRLALSKVDLVEVREEVSLRLVDSWGISTPVRLVADAAFLFEARPPSDDFEIVGTNGGPSIGITVRKWFREADRQAGYERTVADFIDRLVEERDAMVVFIPQVTYADGGDDDRETARRLASSVARVDRFRVVEDELPAAAVKWLCSRMDFFVGTRMHSNIFALSSGVPALAIAYQPKTSGIMSRLGLGDAVLNINELTTESLLQAFDALVAKGPDVRKQLERMLPEIREEALEAGRLVGEVFIGSGRPESGTGGKR